MAESKQYLMQIALELFMQKGFKEVTMDELVEKSGMSKGAFYHYFENKEQIYEECAEILLEMGKFNYETIRSDSFHSFYHGCADYLQEKIQFFSLPKTGGSFVNFYMLLFDAASRFPRFLEKNLAFYRKDVSVWVDVISKARKNGEIKSSASDEQIAEIYLFSIDGLFLRTLNNKRLNFFREDFIRMFDFFYEGIKA